MNGLHEPDRVVVINDDAIERGGAATMALASARRLRGRGVPVAFLSGSDAVDETLAAAGIAVSVLGGRHLLERSRGIAAMRGLYDPTTKAALDGWIAAHDTPGTVYHLHNWHKVLSPSAFAALRPVARRLVISAHDYFLACPNGGYFIYPRQRECGLVPNGARCIATACDQRNYAHKLWRVARHAVRRRLFDPARTGALVLAPHEAMLPLLTRGSLPADRIAVVRNPVMPWRSTRIAAERNRDVFFVGRLDRDKGPDLLAAAAQRAGVRLRLIGDGPLGAMIAQRYANVELLGWRSRTEIAALVGEARLVVSPTRSRETFGLTSVEALTSGIPVVVPHRSALAEEIVASGFGFACDPHDEPGLAGLLSRLADDDRLVRRMSRRAFAGAGRLAPTPDAWCDQLLAVYARRLEEAGPRRGAAANGAWLPCSAEAG